MSWGSIVGLCLVVADHLETRPLSRRFSNAVSFHIFLELPPLRARGSSWWSSHQEVERFQRPRVIKNSNCENARYFKWERPSNAHLYVIYSFAIFLYCVNVWNCTLTTTRKTKSWRKMYRHFYVPFWPACPPTLYQSPWDWIIIMYFNATSTQGVIFFNDRCISSCWTLSYLANEVILMVCNER